MDGGGGAHVSESLSGLFVISDPVGGATVRDKLALDVGLGASCAPAAREVVLEISEYEASYGRGDPFLVTIPQSNHTGEVSTLPPAGFSSGSNALGFETDLYDGSVWGSPLLCLVVSGALQPHP